MVNFKEIVRGSKVYGYFKTDTRPEMDEALKKYFNDWPFGGYLTEVVRQGENMDGGWYAHTIRIGSCD
jgi:hypothetical protein